MTPSIDIQALIGLWKAREQVVREQVVPEATLVNVEVRRGSRIETAGDVAPPPETEEPRAAAPPVGSRPPADPARPADVPEEGPPPAGAPPPGAAPSPPDAGVDEGTDEDGLHETPRVTTGGPASGLQANPPPIPLVVVSDADSPAASPSSVAAHSANQQSDADARGDPGAGGDGRTEDRREDGITVGERKSDGEAPSAASCYGQTKDRRGGDITVGKRKASRAPPTRDFSSFCFFPDINTPRPRTLALAESSAACGDEIPSADAKDAAAAVEHADAAFSREPPADAPRRPPPRKNRLVALSARVFRRNGERAPAEGPAPAPKAPEEPAAGPEGAAGGGGGASGGRRRKGRKPGTGRSGKPMKLRKRYARNRADPADERPPASGGAPSTRQADPESGADRQVPTIFLTSPEGAVTDCVPCAAPPAADSGAALRPEDKGAGAEPYLPAEDYGKPLDGWRRGSPRRARPAFRRGISGHLAPPAPPELLLEERTEFPRVKRSRLARIRATSATAVRSDSAGHEAQRRAPPPANSKTHDGPCPVTSDFANDNACPPAGSGGDRDSSRPSAMTAGGSDSAEGGTVSAVVSEGFGCGTDTTAALEGAAYNNTRRRQAPVRTPFAPRTLRLPPKDHRDQYQKDIYTNNHPWGRR
ncbi:MAG: hypothetical protein BJ554DRAFT_997 [Olpidium bornovanus]|uniref:Uncharacterized protein n=1 Tax=Olpidium bornovanus TaxID=278681 RepID=A0A8H7ZST5_9FUNG|nr:MAG: hypothetical protein BJ554DRAFT_997 [Olpidium bornovanus]